MAVNPIQVACYSGYTYAERPESIVWEGIKHKVEQIEKEWQEPEVRLFEVVTEDSRFFVLSYNERGDEWSAFELTKG
jgi:hypothetical protein